MLDDTTKRIGETIRARRQRLGLSLKELGSLAEIDWSHLAKIERGEGSTGPDTYERILNELGLTLKAVPRLPRRSSPVHPPVSDSKSPLNLRSRRRVDGGPRARSRSRRVVMARTLSHSRSES